MIVGTKVNSNLLMRFPDPLDDRIGSSVEDGGPMVFAHERCAKHEAKECVGNPVLCTSSTCNTRHAVNVFVGLDRIALQQSCKAQVEQYPWKLVVVVEF